VTSASFEEHPPGLENDGGAADETTSAPRLELGAQIVLFVLSVAILVNSLSLGLMVPLGPGAGFFPFFLSIGLGALTVAWFLQSRRAAATRRHASGPAESASASVAHAERAAEATIERRHMINVIVSLVILAVLMLPLGYQIPMFLFIVYHLGFRARRRWYTVLIIALAGSVGVFHIFNDLLSVALPYSAVELLNYLGL
jgi:hypothetical protein